MCTGYEIDGQLTDEIPYEYNTADIRPQFTPYKGWMCSLEGTASYNALPKELLDYLKAIEQQTGVNIRAVSISPDRKDVLFK